MQELTVCVAEEPLWVFEETLPLTPEERKTDAERQQRKSHRYTCQRESSLHRHVICQNTVITIGSRIYVPQL